MSPDRDAMLRALQGRLVPALRERGFTGSIPHFRRIRDGELHLLSVQFSKWGGELIVELGRVRALAPYATAKGEMLPTETLRAVDLELPDRARLHAGDSAAREVWFDFRPATLLRWRNAGRFDRVADALVARLSAADAWWAGHEPGPGVRAYR